MLEKDYQIKSNLLIHQKFHPRIFLVVLLILCKVLSSILESKKLIQLTNRFYSIGSNLRNNANLTYKSLNSAELDSIVIMSKFYPWVIKYSIIKKLDPDNPRYLTKVTHTL